MHEGWVATSRLPSTARLGKGGLCAELADDGRGCHEWVWVDRFDGSSSSEQRPVAAAWDDGGGDDGLQLACGVLRFSPAWVE